MKCTEIRELLPDLAAGLASAPPGANDHLRSCTDCAGKLDEFRKTMALLDEWQAPEPSPYFDTRLHARLREEMAKPPRNLFAWLRRPALAASFALILVAGVTVVRMAPRSWFAWIQRPAIAVSIAVLLVAGTTLYIRKGDGPGPKPPVQMANANTVPGTAVSDLQVLDKNNDLFADADSDSASDLLDDMQVQQDVTANP